MSVSESDFDSSMFFLLNGMGMDGKEAYLRFHRLGVVGKLIDQ